MLSLVMRIKGFPTSVLALLQGLYIPCITVSTVHAITVSTHDVLMMLVACTHDACMQACMHHEYMLLAS